jgi:hypothetical protein
VLWVTGVADSRIMDTEWSSACITCNAAKVKVTFCLGPYMKDFWCYDFSSWCNPMYYCFNSAYMSTDSRNQTFYIFPQKKVKGRYVWGTGMLWSRASPHPLSWKLTERLLKGSSFSFLFFQSWKNEQFQHIKVTGSRHGSLRKNERCLCSDRMVSCYLCIIVRGEALLMEILSVCCRHFCFCFIQLCNMIWV